MNNFCPFLKGDCNSQCIFYTKSKSTITNCRLDAAAVNLEYIGDVIAEHISANEEQHSQDEPAHQEKS